MNSLNQIGKKLYSSLSLPNEGPTSSLNSRIALGAFASLASAMFMIDSIQGRVQNLNSRTEILLYAALVSVVVRIVLEFLTPDSTPQLRTSSSVDNLSPISYGPMPLTNLGNDCFINAGLQAALVVPGYVKIFRAFINQENNYQKVWGKLLKYFESNDANIQLTEQDVQSMIILLLRPRSNVKKTIRDSLTNKNSIFKSVYDTSQDAFAPLPHLENSVIDSFIEWIKTQKEAIKKIVPFSPEYIESINTLENILNLHESLNDPSHKEKSSISTKLLRGLLRSRPSLDLQDDPLEIISPILENLSYGQGGLPRFSFMTEQCKVFIYYCFDDGTMIEIDEKPDNLDTRTRHITTGRYKSDIHKNVVTFKLCVRDDQSDRIALKDLLKEYMDYDIKIVDQELTVKKDGTPELFFLGYKGAKTHDKIIDRMPDVMTLQIVRNNYNPISNKRVYIQPIETINGESYEVRSIVYHSSIRSNNSYNSGHYTALVKKDCEGRDIWWYCDDTTIRKATKEQIDDYLSGGFVYFLQKVDQNS